MVENSTGVLYTYSAIYSQGKILTDCISFIQKFDWENVDGWLPDIMLAVEVEDLEREILMDQ